eukprot:1348184-Rhodomonas_salina.3
MLHFTLHVVCMLHCTESGTCVAASSINVALHAARVSSVALHSASGTAGENEQGSGFDTRGVVAAAVASLVLAVPYALVSTAQHAGEA